MEKNKKGPKKPAKSLKPLYLATNVGALNAMADIKSKVSNVKIFVNSSNKVFRTAEDLHRDGDEEKAYVMYMKYFNIITAVKKTADYKKNEKYYKELIGMKNCIMAIDKAEELSKSLKNRYDEKEAEEVSKKFEALHVHEEEPGAEPESNMDETESEGQSNDKGEANGAPEVFGSEPGLISVQQLYHLVIDPKNDLLMMDVRPDDQFDNSHITLQACINIPARIITPGTTARQLDKVIPEDAKVRWYQRAKADYIILIDWLGSADDIKATSPLHSLKDAIFKWDVETLIKREPLVLEGGYEEWLMYYPTLTTNANVPRPPTYDTFSSPAAALEKIDYDVDLDFLKPPKPVKEDSPGTDSAPDKTNSVGSLRTVYRGTKAAGQNNIDTGQNSNDRNIYKPENTGLNNDLSRTDNKLNQMRAALLEKDSITNNLEKKTSIPIVNRSLKPKQINSDRDLTVSKPEKNELEQAKLSEVEQLSQNLPQELIKIRQVTSEKNEALEKLQNENKRLVLEHQARISRMKQEQQELEHIRDMKDKEARETADLLRLKKKISDEVQALESQRKQGQNEETLREKELAQIKEEEKRKKQLKLQVDKLRQDRKQKEIDAAEKLRLEKEEKLKEEKERQEQETKQRQLQEAKERRLDEEKQRQDELNKMEEISRIKREKELMDLENQRQLKEKLEREKQEKERELKERERQEEILKAQRLREQQDKLAKEKADKEQREAKRRELEKIALEKKKTEEMAIRLQRSRVQNPGLPVGWEKKLDPATGRYFFINHATQKTQWQPPDPPASPKKVGPDVYKTKLKDEPSTPSSGGLKRSHSSPNIAKLVSENESETIITPDKPTIDRSVKPKALRISTDVSTAKVRNLQPTWGTVNHGLTGLRNLGNTCYINSVVQALSSTAPLTTYFLTDEYRYHINRENFLGTRGEVTEEFAVVAKALWAGQYKSITPRDFRMTVAKYYEFVASTRHQDSQELLLSLLDSLHEDLNKVKKRPKIPDQNNDNLPEEVAADQAWNMHKTLNDSVIVDYFQGQFKSTVTCLTCNKKSIKFDAFMYLSLSLPSTSKCSLRDCFLHFSKEEKMTGESMWKCPRCKVKRDAVKRLVIWKLPPILFVHLKRFHKQGMWLDKNSAYVDFPLDNLDVSKYISGPKGRPPYYLYAVSNHYGSLEGGHYTAYAQSPTNHRWHKFDDHEVYEMSKSDVKSSAAYILFYSSIPMELSFK